MTITRNLISTNLHTGLPHYSLGRAGGVYYVAFNMDDRETSPTWRPYLYQSTSPFTSWSETFRLNDGYHTWYTPTMYTNAVSNMYLGCKAISSSIVWSTYWYDADGTGWQDEEVINSGNNYDCFYFGKQDESERYTIKSSWSGTQNETKLYRDQGSGWSQLGSTFNEESTAYRYQYMDAAYSHPYIMVAYRRYTAADPTNTREVRFAYVNVTNGSWSSPVSLSSIDSSAKTPAILRSAVGDIWVSWNQKYSGIYQIYVNRHNGVSWSGETKITDESVDQLWPRVHYTANATYMYVLLWAGLGYGTNTDKYQICQKVWEATNDSPPFVGEWGDTEVLTDEAVDQRYPQGIVCDSSTPPSMLYVWQEMSDPSNLYSGTQILGSTGTKIDDRQIRAPERFILRGLSGYGKLYRRVTSEILSPDGSTTVFALTYTPDTGTVRVYKNGMLLRDGASNDYTISGKNITFNDTPSSDDILQICYLATD